MSVTLYFQSLLLVVKISEGIQLQQAVHLYVQMPILQRKNACWEKSQTLSDLHPFGAG